jgi:hypothetical protein
MIMPLLAKVQVIPEPGAAGHVAAPTARDLSDSDLEQIAAVVSQSVIALQGQLTEPSTRPKGYGLSEVEIKFGIDLQGESKIPIIGPLLGIGVKAGATFQVTIKLTNSA